MSRRPCIVRKSDVRRAIEAAKEMGLTVAGFEVKPDGSIFVRHGQPLASSEGTLSDDLDDVIARIRKNGEARRAS